jgi:hypothetical protein
MTAYRPMSDTAVALDSLDALTCVLEIRVPIPPNRRSRSSARC